MCSIYPDFLARMVELWNWMLCPWSISVQLRPNCPDIQVGFAVDAPLTWCPRNAPSAQCRPFRTHSASCKHLVALVQGGLWREERDWIISCGESSQFWCCVGPALCWFGEYSPDKFRKATESDFLSGWSKFCRRFRAPWICRLLQAFSLKTSLRNTNLDWPWAGWVSMGLGAEVEICVCGLAVHLVSQKATSSPLNI
jgi:hypothetical protein